MRTNSLNNSFSLLNYKNLNSIGRYVATIAAVLFLAIPQAWGAVTYYYYTKLIVENDGNGSATGATSITGTYSTTPAYGKTSNTAEGAKQIYYLNATPKAGYVFKDWSQSGTFTGTFGDDKLATSTFTAESGTKTAETSHEDKRFLFGKYGDYYIWKEYTVQANFAAITLSAPSDVTFTPTNPSKNCSEYTGTLTFKASHSCAKEDFSEPAYTVTDNSGNGTLEVTGWKVVDSTQVEVYYKFTGNNTYGGNDHNRENSFAVTLTTQAGESAKCNVTANFPALAFDSVEATDVHATQGESGKTGSATFTYKYGAKDDFPNAPTLTHVSGSGSFSVTRYTVIPNFSTGVTAVMVEYKFNTNNGVGETVEQLKLTAANGQEKTVTITGHSQAAATDDAKVIAADGTTVIYQGNWATAWKEANKVENVGCTLQVLRDVTGGSLNANQKVTNTFTLDLNSKKLSANYNGSIIYLNTAGMTLTIKDSKTGGRIENVNNAYVGMAIIVNAEKGNLIFESGTLYCENKGASGRRAVGIYNQAGTTVTMNGGKIEVHGYNNSQGVLQTSNKNNDTSFTMNGGEIEVDGYQDIYGISAAGKVNINDGTISVTATYNNCRGITLTASADATAANCYYGQLTMTGGTINSTCTANADGTRNAYGIVLEGSYTASMGTGVATDGSHANKAAATGTIENATINVSTLGRYAYGVLANGSYQSKTNHYDVIQIKNTKIDVTSQYYYTYGVYANCDINTTNGGIYAANIELTNCDVTATTTKYHTAYCVYANAKSATVFKDVQPNYYGEYAVGAKVTINSGNYEATAGTTNAYAVASATRARTIYDSETSVYADRKLGGNAVAYPELIIHGGTFVGHALGVNSDRHARAVSSGGNTTIDGGTFRAVSEGRFARCIYGVAGKLNITNATIDATANGRYAATNMASEATGVYGDVTIQTPTGFTEYCDITLNNCNISANTVRGNTAYGVFLNCTSRPFTELYLRLDSINNGWTHKDDGSGSYDLYKVIYSRGDRSVAAKATINGGTIKAKTDSLAFAYGVYVAGPTFGHYGGSEAACQLTMQNVNLDIDAETSSAYGIITAGPATIDNVTATIKAKTTTACGIQSNYGKTTITNTKLDVTAGTGTAYGYYGQVGISSNTSATTKVIPAGGPTVTIIPAYNYVQIRESEAELGVGNVFDVKTTTNNTAYGIFLNASKANWNTDAYNNAKGEYAYAAKATINGGKYTATASGTTAYAAGVADPVLQGEATATPTLIINDGKFKGTAGAAPFADVSVNGEPGYFVLNGGYYVKDENLDKKLGEGMNKVAVNSGTPEYTEGYRWRVTDNMTGEYVCKIKENGISYASLEEALQVVNADPNSTWTIIMIANYTLSKGDYVLPANTTLLIPYYSTQTAINGAAPTYTSPVKNVEQYEAPSPLYKLTFANGVNMSVYGKIEASAVTYLSNQGLLTHGTGVVSGKYGWLYLNEGSHIDLENGSALYAWGYVTGKGEINAKNGSTLYEDFQMGDWRGGTEEKDVQGNTNGLDNKGVFLITHYYYQNIECPITYRAGAQGFAHGGTYMYMQYVADDKVPTQTAVKMIGTSDAMFLMDPATAGEDTWVRKEYDAETDYVNWTMNSGAKLGSVRLKMKLPFLGQIDLSSSDYVLPITSNFNIIANDGEIQITNHVCFIPGSKLTIKKEGTLTIPSPQRVFFYDQDDWLSYGGYWFHPYYSPSWKVNPRVATIGDKSKIKMPDAEVLVEGLLNVGGAIYTTAGGANIHSTRENAGKVKFGAAPPDPTAATGEKTGNTTLYQWIANGPKYDGKALNPAWLKNENGKYSTPTSDTKAGDTWVYMKSLTEDTYEWTLASENGCFTIRKTGDTKTYVHPSDWVAVGEANDDHAYPSEDGTRMFVNTEAASTDASCKWWDVNPTPDTIDGVIYYIANNEYFDNYGTYFYWDNETSYWKPKKITVTWKNYDGSKLDNGTYGDEYNFNTSPQFYGTNPTKTNTTVEKYDWIGWRDEEGNIYDKNATLPRAKSNVTYTAYFNTTKYQYTITFKNDDNSDLWAGLVDAGTTGAELQVLFEQKYNEKTGNTVPQKAPTVDKVFAFAGWNNPLATVEAAATYVAQYSESLRQYHVIFYNYDAVSVLYEADVDYNANPVYGGVTPFRANTSAFSYDWTGWKQGATTYGTSDKLPKVMGDISYIATFDTTALKYQVLFKRQDGSIIDAPFFSYEEKPDAFPANPTMASTVSTDYTFREWSPATLEPVTEDGKVYTALFDESPRQYTAHFVNYNGVSLNKDQTIDYNTVPAYTGATPFKPNDARNSYVFSGWAWTAGDGWEAGSIAAGEAFPAIKGNITFTAQFTPTLLQLDAGFYVDIVDVDNSEKTLKLNVSGTEWVTAGWPYEVNGTVYYRDQAKATAAGSDKYRATDRTLTIPYTGEPGENFTVTIRNASSTLVSKHTYIIPQEIKSATTLTTDQTAPIFVKGATMTVNADIEATNIYVGHDAKLVINSGVTLTADSLFLRTKPESAAELVINESGAVAGTTKVLYTRIILSKSGYFQFGLPLSCPISAVRLSNGKTVGYKSGTGWILRYYDEDKRATTGPGDNWATLDAAASIAAGRGYEMYSGVDYYREFYFPVDLSQMTNTVYVDYTAGEQPTNNGWNVLVSPLTHTFTNTPQPEGMKISWMQLDGSFLQEPLTTVAPAMTFAYQAVKEGSLVFDGSNVTVPTLAPRRVAAVEEATRIQWMHLDIKDANGLGDQTSIYSHPTRYDQTFKMGVDEEKQSLTASRALLYSSHAYGEMAFAGVADELLEQGVALTVYSPKTQELTISMRENEWLDRMAFVWLIDKATGAQIDLLESDYSFSAEAGTTAGRFFLMGAFFAPQITTDNGTVQGDDEDIKAKKFIYKDKMYIQINGVIYDATGKLVK